MKILATLGDSLIVGINGRLRLVDTKRKGRCMGYTSGCQCPQCQAKERHLVRQRTPIHAQKAAKCECGGTILGKEDTCFKCGKAVARAA